MKITTMPFKIVQTVEKGLPRLSIVPSVWEDDGRLFWPPVNKVKNRGRLIRDENSYPNPNWDILRCKLKRNNIATYSEAEEEMQSMENKTDTEHETTVGQTPAIAAQRLEAMPPANHFGLVMQNLAQTPYKENENITTHESLSVFDGDANQLNILMQKINNQELILKNLVQRVQKVTYKVAELSIQLNESLVTLLDRIKQPMPATSLTDDQLHNKSFSFKQIMNKKQLEDVETMLTDDTERLKLQNQLGFLFQPCDGNGQTFAYKLIDLMVSREFICECSWSGGSRGNFSKVPLKDYKNFIMFFFEMVRSWDSKFTMEQTETFLKAVLKNAVKRKSLKNLRCSSKRIRKIKPKLNDQAFTNTILYTSTNPNEVSNEMLDISSQVWLVEENRDEEIEESEMLC